MAIFIMHHVVLLYQIQLVHVQNCRHYKAITTSEGSLPGILDHLQPYGSTNSNPFELHMPAETMVVEKGWETK